MAARTVYLLFTRSQTWFSRLIHLATSDPYTHVSIGLDGPAGPFYSFARKNPRTVLPAGLVEEQVGEGFFGLHPAIPCLLCALEVEEKTFEDLRRRLEAMYARRGEYRYNFLGAVGCWFRFPLVRRRCYFCSQFVAQLLVDTGAAALPSPPALTRPADLCAAPRLRTLLRGRVGALAQASACPEGGTAPVPPGGRLPRVRPLPQRSGRP